MNSQTSLVAADFRLTQWAEQIRECQNRPAGMNVDAWCEEHGITKANYYYRLKRVRQALLQQASQNTPEFIDISSAIGEKQAIPVAQPAAVLRSPSGAILEIADTASENFLHSLIGAMFHAE